PPLRRIHRALAAGACAKRIEVVRAGCTLVIGWSLHEEGALGVPAILIGTRVGIVGQPPAVRLIRTGPPCPAHRCRQAITRQAHTAVTTAVRSSHYQSDLARLLRRCTDAPRFPALRFPGTSYATIGVTQACGPEPVAC